MFCDRYEVESELAQDIFTFTDQYQVKTYKGIDKLENRPILIRSLHISNVSESLRNFVLDFWNHELRITRRALAATKGKNVTRLVDAQFDEKNLAYVLIFENPGATLKDLINISEENSSIFSPNVENRRHLWQAFLNLAEALSNLHQNFMLHRNLSLNAIFWDNLEQDFTECLSIGNFSLSIYLHSLFQQISSNKLKPTTRPKKKWTIYCAPEIVGVSEPQQTFAGENFSSDLFSFGLILAQCLLRQELDENIFSTTAEYKNSVVKIIELVRTSTNFLQETERELCLNLVTLDGSKRLKNATEVMDSIKNIIMSLKSGEIKVVDSIFPMFIRDDPEKDLFYKDISNALDLHGSAFLPNNWIKIVDWLRNEFKECAIYPSNHESQLIWTRGKSGTIYSARPFTSSVKQELPVGVMRFEYHPAAVIPSPIPSPICYMKEGLEWVQGDLKKYLSSPWGDVFARAKDWRSKNQKREWTKVAKFEKIMELMLEAEEILESVNVLPFERVNIEKMEFDRLKKKYSADTLLQVKILYDKEHPEYGSLKYTPLPSFIEDVVNSSNRRVELSNEYMPFADLQEENLWEAVKWDIKNSTILFRKESSRGECLQPDFGYLRPWSLKLTSQLFYRKKKGIDTLISNRQLIDTLLDPRYNVFFPLRAIQPLDVTAKITSTIPIFLIQGPPGTGKTYTVVETIKKILLENASARILVSSKEHNALDDLVIKLSLMLQQLQILPEPILIRLISSDKEQEYSQNHPVRKYFTINATKTLTQDILDKDLPSSLGSLKEEWLQLIQTELNAPSLSWARSIRKSATIVCTTMTAAELQAVRRFDPPFDWVVVEEAGKAYPTELGLAIICGNRWLLIGDQKQLPPYLQDELVEKLNERLSELKEDEFASLSETEFNEFRETLVKDTKFFGNLYAIYEKTSYCYGKSGECPVHRLTEQYRMVPILSDMIAKVFYNDIFINRVKPLPPTSFVKEPKWLQDNDLIWLETPSSSQSEEALENRTSKMSVNNPFEATIIVKLLGSIKFSHETLDLQEKAEIQETPLLQVLTPYQGQTDYLRATASDLKLQFKFDPDVHIATVDSFQGKQCMIAVISLVRNNDYEDPHKALGFLLEPERLNVMFSRAKYKMVIVGSLKHIDVFSEKTSREWQEILRYIRKSGKIITSTDVLKGGG